jgi:hypothetical protein
MGCNTAVIIMNDAMGAIEKCPDEFVNGVRGLRVAMGQFMRGDKPADIGVGGHANAATVFHQQHADVVGIHAIGGNHTSQLLLTHNGGHHYTDEHRLALLKQLADEHGYRLVKKRK